jgi:asparagine synthase (glutamine-hydrolysing)
MCGLFASVGFTPDPDRIDRVAHRGPDGRGWEVFLLPAGPVALGHRRLAIIDTSDAGLQPLADVSGRLQILLNGEIYNYIELREELRSKGRVFVTATDTEVLLQAYMEWGDAALDRLVGMFAFVILDLREQRLFAARDRYGIKPLYITSNAHGVALASEIKQLVGLSSVTQRVNQGRLRDFLIYGMQDHTEETLFDGISQIRGGECLSLDLSNQRIQPEIRRWYQIPEIDVRSMPPEAAAEGFHALLEQSVRLHLRSDVQVGSCLSGGLDSSTIVVMVSRLLAEPAARQSFATVSAVYPGTSVDEGIYAKAVSDATGFNAFRMTPDPLMLRDHLDSIVHVQDEPFGSTSILSQWSVFKAAKDNGIKVMLDGQGADEHLAGYHWMIARRLADLLSQGRLLAFAGTMRDHAAHGGSLPGDVGGLLRQMLPHGWRTWLRGLRRDVAEGGWLKSGDRPAASAESTATDRLGWPKVQSLDGQCRLLTHATNLPMLLHWEDRNSMAHGIEARVPFLDHRLVEFSLRLSADNKFDKSLTKRVLRDAMKDRLPGLVLNRRDKLGFATPEKEWMRGPLRDVVLEGVSLAVSRFPDLFQAAATQTLAHNLLDANGPMDFTLWRIANTGLWARRFGINQ